MMSSMVGCLSGLVVLPRHAPCIVILHEWSTGRHCTVAALQPPAHTSCRYLMCLLLHVMQAHDGGPDIRRLGNMCACLSNV
jgi:hypothetical protein